MERYLKFTIMWKDEECTLVTVDRVKKKASVEYLTTDANKRGINIKSHSIEGVMQFLKSRCFPEDRVDRDELLEMLGLINYSPLSIAKKTHGILYDDFTWVKFAGEDITYKDVKIR